MEKVRVGIIGTGGISHFHMLGYQKLPNVEVVAACDINKERVSAFAKKYNIANVFTDYHEMLKMDNLDAVSVTTWNSEHAPVSIAALKAGKNVLCEKPLALNAQQAEEMVKVSKETGKLLMVGFVRRFGENAQMLKHAIEEGQLGNIYYAKTGNIRRWGNPSGWFSDKKRSGGGPVIDLGVHMIDLVRFITGKPKAVSVTAYTFNMLGMRPDIKGFPRYLASDPCDYNDVEDAATSLIKFDNGLVLFFESSWVMHTNKESLFLEVYGDKAGAQMEPTLEFYEEKDKYMRDSKVLLDPSNYSFEHNFIVETRHFADCVANGTECINPAEDGLELMKILDAIYESAKVQHEVFIK